MAHEDEDVCGSPRSVDERTARSVFAGTMPEISVTLREFTLDPAVDRPWFPGNVIAGKDLAPVNTSAPLTRKIQRSIHTA